ncbi:hypothetical protein [Paludibacterium sp.]|uniref:nucleotide-binding protein n=1 Tax=Paludibacterium sp. TaxID=1917523 RepID=UPI0025DCE190|nr:hypothetical protein [Paludibacterium sp.]MBV8649631.1 hypothetical protein [Paludibacterium sp.]
MPVIVLQSPKGGAGKTTTALILATTLVDHYSVTVIDADPNHPFAVWGKGGNVPDKMQIVSDVDEENILDKIDGAQKQSEIVIVDLEGTKAKIVLLAISQADFVIIPTQGSALDAIEANKAVKLVRDQERMTARKTNFAVLLTRTSPTIRARNLTHIQASLIQAGIPVLQNELNEREAFKSVVSYMKPLQALTREEVPSIEKALINAYELAKEIMTTIAETEETETNKGAA